MDTCATNRKTLHIAEDDKPAEVVRSRFMKLNADHIRFVLMCLAENSSPIRNMKQYLLASLYNAPTTMQLYYQNKTNHEFTHGSPRGGDFIAKKCTTILQPEMLCCLDEFEFFLRSGSPDNSPA